MRLLADTIAAFALVVGILAVFLGLEWVSYRLDGSGPAQGTTLDVPRDTPGETTRPRPGTATLFDQDAA